MNEWIKTCISKPINEYFNSNRKISPVSPPTHNPACQKKKKKKPWLSLFGKSVLLWYLFWTDDYNVF